MKAWGVGKNFPLENLKKDAVALACSTKSESTNPTRMSVIDSLAAAKVKFSARNLFIANHICELTDKEEVFAYDSTTKAGQLHECREFAKAEWVLTEPEVVHFWEAQF